MAFRWLLHQQKTKHEAGFDLKALVSTLHHGKRIHNRWYHQDSWAVSTSSFSRIVPTHLRGLDFASYRLVGSVAVVCSPTYNQLIITHHSLVLGSHLWLTAYSVSPMRWGAVILNECVNWLTFVIARWAFQTWRIGYPARICLTTWQPIFCSTRF